MHDRGWFTLSFSNFSSLASLNLRTLIATGYFKQPQSESQSQSKKKKRGAVMQAHYCMGGTWSGAGSGCYFVRLCNPTDRPFAGCRTGPQSYLSQEDAALLML